MVFRCVFLHLLELHFTRYSCIHRRRFFPHNDSRACKLHTHLIPDFLSPAEVRWTSRDQVPGGVTVQTVTYLYETIFLYWINQRGRLDKSVARSLSNTWSGLSLLHGRMAWPFSMGHLFFSTSHVYFLCTDERFRAHNSNNNFLEPSSAAFENRMFCLVILINQSINRSPSTSTRSLFATECSLFIETVLVWKKLKKQRHWRFSST